MPVGYGEIFNWLVAALGAALLLGTGAALVTYRRTGTLPGGPGDDQAARPGAKATMHRSRVRTAVLKCVVGALLVVLGLARLAGGGVP